MTGTPEVDGALQGFRDVLAADGYRLNWRETGPARLAVTVEAGPDACAECLVPQPVMEAIMSDALSPIGYTVDHVVLPDK